MPAQRITKELAGRWYGSYGVARCPAHDDREPCLSIREAKDGKVLVRCHAGCDQERVIATLRSRGLWPGNGAHPAKATGHPVWAALSTAGLLALELPDHVQDVIILADGDAAGEAAARGAALRWKREGRRVRIAHPPEGMDFNDLLLRGTPRVKGDE